MSDSANYALHRPEFLAQSQRGEEKIAALMGGMPLFARGGTELVTAESQHDYVYRLVSGWACRSRSVVDGRTQIILIFLPGDLFAVKSMFHSIHTDAVELLTDATFERIDYRELHAAFADDGDVASRCMMQVMEEERRLHNWVVGLGLGTAEERLCALVLDLRSRLTNSNADVSEGRPFQLPLTQAQLGNYLSLTNVHVSRVLRMLREKRLLTLRAGLLTIHSLAGVVSTAYALLDVHERKLAASETAALRIESRPRQTSDSSLF